MSPSPGRPEPSEYHDAYAGYVEQVPEGPILELLESELEITLGVLSRVPAEMEEHRYAPDKWSVREVVGHVLDSERLFGYRALSIARDDPASLPSMDQEQWAANSSHGRRPLIELAAELELLRRSHLLMFRGFSEEAWRRRGVASGREFSVRSFPWILVGHEIHHRTVLRERYLSDEELGE